MKDLQCVSGVFEGTGAELNSGEVEQHITIRIQLLQLFYGRVEIACFKRFQGGLQSVAGNSDINPEE